MMKVLRGLIFMVLVSVFMAGAVTAEAQLSFDSALVDQNAPAFKLKTFNGPVKDMTAAREGKDTILFFWATWCPHCREQLKELSAQKAAIEGKGIKVLLVDVGEEASLVRAYVKKYNVPYEIFLDEDSEVSEQYELIGVPTFYFINKAGVVKNVDHVLPEDSQMSSIFQEG